MFAITYRLLLCLSLFSLIRDSLSARRASRYRLLLRARILILAIRILRGIAPIDSPLVPPIATVPAVDPGFAAVLFTVPEPFPLPPVVNATVLVLPTIPLPADTAPAAAPLSVAPSLALAGVPFSLSPPPIPIDTALAPSPLDAELPPPALEISPPAAVDDCFSCVFGSP